MVYTIPESVDRMLRELKDLNGDLQRNLEIEREKVKALETLLSRYYHVVEYYLTHSKVWDQSPLTSGILQRIGEDVRKVIGEGVPR